MVLSEFDRIQDGNSFAVHDALAERIRRLGELLQVATLTADTAPERPHLPPDVACCWPTGGPSEDLPRSAGPAGTTWFGARPRSTRRYMAGFEVDGSHLRGVRVKLLKVVRIPKKGLVDFTWSAKGRHFRP